MKYRKKPVVIEAMRFDGSNADEIVKWAQGDWALPVPFMPDGSKRIWIKQKVFPDADANAGPVQCLWFLVIPTLEGDHEAAPGDWIIRGIKGELYPIKPDIFAATYEPVHDTPAKDERRERDIPDPCTEEARYQGCTCSMPFVSSAAIDPPEPERDEHCPLHGRARDPDDALQELRDARNEDEQREEAK